ncbi:hypothetical protein GWK91_12765 [Virgibacillus sp. MSP4-1]|uniref:hypothetical protein n=1 Tax=Virgibacillus sp. MSP4-1 TaxID=2700081 RepID=UPI0005C72917|nr:hypothetical protein [Virgibacillus sp. MSP4-1]QHS23766.1 hypothetical protein GWK91_12765 [Virgibacillus sp. MSP4-1]
MLKEKIKGIIICILSIPLLIGLIILSSETVTAPPSNLQIILDHRYQEYYSPACLNKSNIDVTKLVELGELQISTLRDARDTNYKATNCTYEILNNPRLTFTSTV